MTALGLDERGKPSVTAMRLLAQMRQGQGRHAAAVKIVDKALAAGREEGVRPPPAGTGGGV